MGFFTRATVPDGGTSLTGYNFTERVRKILATAREEAGPLHHEYVGTEHILLGLIREGEGVAAAVLENLGAERDVLRARLLGTIKPGNAPAPTGPDLPYTSRAKKVLELAMAEARELNHSYVGTEHLLLGLVREEKGIAAQVLVDVGVTLTAARTETLRLLGNEAPPAVASRAEVPRADEVPRQADGAAVGRPAAPADEARAWQRLLHARDVTARLGGTADVALEADGSLTVSLGPDLVVSVALPADARVRRREGPGEDPRVR